jgi:hypothetical protein
VFLGEGYSNLPRIISILAETLVTDMLEAPLQQRCLLLLHNIQNSLPPEVAQQLWAQLDNRVRQKLAALSQQ